jgi:triosephosphate isomerase
MRTLFIAGNWKMHMGAKETENFCRDLKVKGLKDKNVDILLCPPFTSIPAMVKVLNGVPVHVGGQNMHQEDKGAFTGEISASMLKEAGCSHVLIGHSERRQYFYETDAGVNAKVKKALEKELTPVICIGETREEREKEITEDVVRTQLLGALEGMSTEDILKTVIAYEPVWAIGTGLTATPEQAQEVHRYIREVLAERTDVRTAQVLRILYGGSAKPENAGSLLSETDIDGLLIGGASLNADHFFRMIETAATCNA